MSFSRRSFLQISASATVGVCLPELGSSQAALAQSSNQVSFESSPQLDLTPTNFSQQLNTTFDVTGPNVKRVRLTLVEVVDQSDRINEGSTSKMTVTSFLLCFRGNRSASLTQDTYQFKHPVMGTFPMFLVPGRENGQKKLFHVVINRIVG